MTAGEITTLVFVSPGEGDALWVGGDAVTGIDGEVEL
jgi:hypothetical protein